MQPYFLPYLGYWQLMYNADIFVVYDDVTYIKQGWINRNKILINSKPAYLTLQLKNASSFKLIKDTEININPVKMLKTVYQTYCKSEMFEDAYPIFGKIICRQTDNLADFVMNSILIIRQYLDIKTIVLRSSCLPIPENLKGAERVKFVCNYVSKQDPTIYINSIGGTSLYDYQDFKNDGIDLRFLKSEINPEDTLSILDLMFKYPKETLKNMLHNYKELKDGSWAI
jgi:hypothetical protein